MAFQHSTSLRVRYSETDKMGYVYYGVYASYFEVARVEALRSIGVSYKSLEDVGVLLPVSEYSVRYHIPGKYDDELTITTTIEKQPGVRIDFSYKVVNQLGEALSSAHTQLVFVDEKTRRPMRPPAYVMEAFQPYF